MKSMTRSQKWVLFIIVLLAFLTCVGGYFAWKATHELADVRMQASDAERQVKLLEARLAKAVIPPDLAKMNQAIPPDWQMPRFIADVTLLANEYGIQIHSLTPGEPIQPEVPQEPQEGTQGQEGTSDVEGGTEQGEELVQTEQTENTNEGTETDAGSDGNAGSQETAQKEPFSPQPPSSLPGVHTLPLSMEVKGNITDVLAFIDALQQLPRLVWVTGFELLAAEEEQDSGQTYEKPTDLRIDLNLYSKAPWDAVELEEAWPFDISPAGNVESFDTL